jgi:DNA processing protein
LIQQGAKLVISVDDILEDLQNLFPDRPVLAASKPPDLEGDLLKIYEAIESSETSIDRIIDASGLAANVVTSGLLHLEMQRLVKQLPGKFFVKLL